jgi:hypothetical protein
MLLSLSLFPLSPLSLTSISHTDEKKENLTYHQTIEDLEAKIDMLSEKSRSQQEELNSRQRDQARERGRERKRGEGEKGERKSGQGETEGETEG